MRRIDTPIIVNADATKAVKQQQEDMQPTYKYSNLWPFTLTVMTTRYGSKSWAIEFRPIQKWSIVLTFFWKASRE